MQGKRETERETSVCDVLARSYLRVGRYKQSIEYGKNALSFARYVRNREREIDAPVVLSGSYYEFGDYHDLSVECCKRALSIAKEQKKKSGRMRCSSLAKHSIEYGKQ